MSPDFHRQFISSFRMTTSIRYHSRCYLVFVLKNSQLNFRDCLIIQLSMFRCLFPATFISYHTQLLLSRTFLTFFKVFYFVSLSLFFSLTAYLAYHIQICLSRTFLKFFKLFYFVAAALATAMIEYHTTFPLSTLF